MMDRSCLSNSYSNSSERGPTYPELTLSKQINTRDEGHTLHTPHRVCLFAYKLFSVHQAFANRGMIVKQKFDNG